MRVFPVLVCSLLLSLAAFPSAPAGPTDAGPAPVAGNPSGRADLSRADRDILEWINPYPTGSSLNGVAWPAGSDHALAVGNAGTFFRYDPFLTRPFTMIQSGVPDDLNAISFRPDGAVALVAGDLGTILLYDGGTPRPLATGTQKNLNDVVWAPDGGSALIPGNDGTLLLYDGTSVTRLNTTTALDIHAGAWAPGDGHALLVGEKGLCCRANATAFEVLDSGTSLDLTDVDFRPGSYATIVGVSGTVLRFDGSAFASEGPAPLQTFHAVSWSSDGSVALLVGLDTSDINQTRASAHLLTGSGLAKLDHNITDRARGVAWEPGTAVALVVGANGLFAEYSAGAFTVLSSAVVRNMLSAAWRDDGSYALVAGAGGWLGRYDGSSLSDIPTGQVAELDAVAWHPGQEYALACGRGGLVLRYNHSDSGVEALQTGLQGAIDFTSVSWKPDGSSALLVGESGKMVKYNDTGFHLQQPANPLLQVNLWDVGWRPDGAFALIAGVSGNILRYEERALPPPLDFCVTRAAGAPGVSFFSLSWLDDPSRGEALVSGTNGALYRFNDSGATSYQTDTRRSLYAVSWMPGSEYALAAGDGGTLLEYVGHGFTHPVSGSDAVFRDVAWRPDGSYALVMGHSGALLKFTMARRATPLAVISSPREGAVFEPGATVLFDGTNSTPTFGQPLFFHWTSNLSGDLGDGARISKVLGAGRHRITLFANDTSGHSGTASVSILVKAPNRSPVVVLDSPQEGGTFNDTDDILFDASRSYDPDGDPLSFFWTSSRGGFLGSAPSFTARLGIGAHVVTVWLNDGMGYNMSRSVTVNVVRLNRPPAPLLGSPQPGRDYDDRLPVVFDASGSTDEDGDVLDFFWTSNVTGWLGSADRFSRVLPAGAHTITVWVDDGRGANVSASVDIVVKPANTAPSVTVDVPAEGAVLKGVVEFSGIALDPEGAPLAVMVQVDGYPWADAGGNASWNYTFDTTKYANGRHTVRVKASDGSLESEMISRNVTVANPGWGWTVGVSFPLDGTQVGGKVRIEGAASRIGSAIVQVEARFDGGDWVVASGTTQWSLTWDSTKVRNGPHNVTVRAYDGTDYSPEMSVTLDVDNPPAYTEAPPWLLWAKILIVIVVAVAVAALVLGRKRSPAETVEPEPSPDDIEK
ncbi:MAG: hypothetical protein FJ149_02480 [Euryarchaeota archaeon]|nr:hypothetical protein [Euryarchaeota archaeon]